MTDDSETDEEAVVKSVAVGPTAAAGAVDAKSSVAAPDGPAAVAAVAAAGAARFYQAIAANADEAMVAPEAAAAGTGVDECAANPAHAAAGPEPAAAGARLCEATPRTVRIWEVALGIFVNAAGERCDRCLIPVKFSVAQVSIVSFNQTCMP